ncbi:MAG: four helix bundle protein [Gemmatimonadaceae bacterium]
MQDYHNLSVWRKAHELATRVHLLSAKIPRATNADMISQIRRAALSIPANIAEGCGRSSNRDFARFLQISFGSATELEYHLEFAAAIELISNKDFEDRRAEIIQVRRMLTGLIRAVNPGAMSQEPAAENGQGLGEVGRGDM